MLMEPLSDGKEDVYFWRTRELAGPVMQRNAGQDCQAKAPAPQCLAFF
jgi:hypothetical protein